MSQYDLATDTRTFVRQVRDVLLSWEVGREFVTSEISDAIGYDKDDGAMRKNIAHAIKPMVDYGVVQQIGTSPSVLGNKPNAFFKYVKKAEKFRKEVMRADDLTMRRRKERYGGRVPPATPKPVVAVAPPPPPVVVPPAVITEVPFVDFAILDKAIEKAGERTLNALKRELSASNAVVMADRIAQTRAINEQLGKVSQDMDSVCKAYTATAKELNSAFAQIVEQLSDLKLEVQAVGEMLARREPIANSGNGKRDVPPAPVATLALSDPPEAEGYEDGEAPHGLSIRQLWRKFHKQRDFVALIERVGGKFLKSKGNYTLYAVGKATISIPPNGGQTVPLDAFRDAYRSLKGMEDIDLKKVVAV